QVGELAHRCMAYGQIIVTEADIVLGRLQLPKLGSTFEKGVLVVTVTYFLALPPPAQVEPQATWAPRGVHSQKTWLLAVAPARPVAVCAVVLMSDELFGAKLPYWAPSRAPWSKADFCRL